jgi:hypothetical protein
MGIQTWAALIFTVLSLFGVGLRFIPFSERSHFLAGA